MKRVIKLPVIKQKNFITTKTIKNNLSFLITLDHDKNYLRMVKWMKHKRGNLTIY